VADNIADRPVEIGENNGFCFFYTNYQSQKKGKNLPKISVARSIFWAEMERQVRIEGLHHSVPEE